MSCGAAGGGDISDGIADALIPLICSARGLAGRMTGIMTPLLVQGQSMVPQVVAVLFEVPPVEVE